MFKNFLMVLALGSTLVFSTLAVEAKSKSHSLSVQSAVSSQQGKLAKVSTININKANEQQLAKMLKGVGLKKARAIVEYRNQFGAFKSISELSAVKGIGKQTIEKNKSIITL